MNAGNYQYVSAAGTTIWDNTANAPYNNRVAGIGRDDASALLQKQSQSSYGTGSQVTMAIGTVATTNSANTSTISTDNQFQVWGDDNGSITATTSISGLKRPFH